MRRLLLLPVTLAFAAALLYGCDETTPTENPTVDTDPSLGRSSSRRGVKSSFKRDGDDWTLVGDTKGDHAEGVYNVWPYYSSTEGNPGGCIYAVDAAHGEAWYFQAPPKYLGDQRNAYRGTLEFDLKIEGSGNLFYAPDVIMAGDEDKTIMIRVSPSPSNEWTHYSVPLAEGAGWKHDNAFNGPDATGKEIRAVLKHLTVLRIRGEHIGGWDTGYLDNVRLRRK